MARDTGFFQLRRGIWEHVRDGRMSLTEVAAFIYIGTQADTRTGIWKGSAKSLSGELGMPERTARDVLERMEHGDYIRRFATPGRHSCYPILVHKFLITNGEHHGEQVNALDSASPIDLTYFPREHDGERGVELDGEHGAAQKRSKTVEGRLETKTTSRFALPEWVPQPAWDDFLEMRTKSLRSTPTEKAKALLVGKLQKLKAAGHNPKDLIEEATEKGWKSFYAPKSDGKVTGNGRKQTIGDAARITIEAQRAAATKFPA